ncbi:3,4-dihydroxy-2-butanone-4-phosphate synthase [Candidatus Woesearchaeota archaeon]|jgi:3,4-dihydroxy 2-butanone 4-phosphate synthase / GTP cyclohydrolase II|nr:3,4-dihydroxy-2-butanone-4-phosphate synthase [Candidatus Woesearchaeota archaeon]MBT5272045.1 3,4-dihydroxy-2-butanone-4-phosphate synthase [Candidatus Woesearchaeota archaeon]MBT6041795.1 3,4-dihydroxy-2-butanone-4-phosphate synthase [Candidatus Woesearchaeota archaeon]MBT6336830.1 3,4-dihydroxy-2-butanone-4-phosphate synthase [Candidatus Woesearchaeota archaeon]MBT7927635.1 3,4-dihydroxy-2-butanone-4-phosphate synthase [Candidatus Woesearchaeota archaeon]
MQQIISELKSGNFVIVTDHKNREDEADLIMAAEFITPDKIAFLLDHCSGIICVPMSKKRIQKIGIPIIENITEIINKGEKTCPFTVAVDAKECHTGISAYDRFLTIKKLCDDNATISDFSLPGHMFPLSAHPNGLAERKGHTEAGVELMKIAGLKEVSVICELMNSSANTNDKEKLGTVMKAQDIKEFSEKHNLKVISIEDITQKN